ncbi:MAG: hypothetical protein KDD69_16485 [Bdellovibrionales bacterium]|nr:hypothetical protein [Bdellovibrionales bacterium]
MHDDESIERLFSLAVEQVDSEDIRAQLLAIQEGTDAIELAQELTDDSSADEANVAALIRELNFAGKVKLALKGNLAARTVLLKESNKQIQLFVLSNPRLTDGEVTEIARNTNVDEAVLRAVAKDSQWMKSYAVKYNLVSNPKTPIDVSLQWLKFIKDKDLRLLSRSKGVPQVVATHCRKLLEKRSGG